VTPPSTTGRVRVYVAGAADAPITHAALTALARNPHVDIVGLDLERIDPARLRAVAPDLLLSAAHQRLIRPPELAVARLGTVGLHPALLPRYRGSHPLWWALRNGELEAGLTLYVLDAGIDTGPILDQAAVRIEPGDTFGSLYRRVVTHVEPLLASLVDQVVATGRLPEGRIQDETRATLHKPPTDHELHGTLGQRVVRRTRRTAIQVATALLGALGALHIGGGD
jgi:methionyl-tRNA formyltransferase